MKSRYVFPRNCAADLPVAVGGDGVYLIAQDGTRILDACGGAAVSCLGHSNPNVIAAIQKQVGSLAYAHTSFFTSEPAEELAEFLATRAPGDLNRVYFVSGGSEAMESALKLARQYFVEAGKPEKSQIIGRWQSYHGNTLGALATGGNRWRRAQFAPLLSDAMHHIDPCYTYRGQRDDETEFDYGQRVANQLEEKILELGAQTVAAFVAEPVVGATMGAVPSVDGYFKRIRAICDKYDVLLILDEVMCGMGRTGHLFACNHDGVEPDMIAIAKGLGAGYQPIGALLVSDGIFDTLAAGTGFFQHGHTYLGHPTACAGALAVMHEIEAQNLLPAVRQRGEALRASLTDKFGAHPNVGDIRGRGLFMGVELVEDRDTKAVFSPSKRVHARLKSSAMKAGLMCYPMGGTIDGQAGDHILLAPPFIIDDSHIAEITDKLSIALEETLEAIR
ncbi:aspartate aminotransferase family protein [Pararhizobium sp. IMCC21322]|uniref:aspartate aminotransferase family protein n=1 Tax=Pararhizobium sp. IMCC21322 TaxID=3067903 RepID=UPI00274131AA|nr:aspartate aminotransferase family protein [Pararhizobium sp. IMCC21322]